MNRLGSRWSKEEEEEEVNSIGDTQKLRFSPIFAVGKFKQKSGGNY